MPPLKKWGDIIKSEACWDELRQIPTKEEQNEICQWEGWHWILRAHLEMFYGLKKIVEVEIVNATNEAR